MGAVITYSLIGALVGGGVVGMPVFIYVTVKRQKMYKSIFAICAVVGIALSLWIFRYDISDDLELEKRHTKNSNITEKNINDANYYKKNGKWYYQGKGNQKSENEKGLWDIMKEIAGE